MLLPALASAKARAQQAGCISNQKQLALANIMYVGDNGKFITPSGNSYLGGYGEWMGSLLDYYQRATNLLVCPVAKSVAAQGSTYANGAGWTGTANKSYFVNLAGGNPPPTSGWQTIIASYQANGWLYTSPGGQGQGDGNISSYPCSEASHGVSDPTWYYGKDTSMEKPVNTPMFMDGVWVDAWPLENDGPANDLWLGSSSGYINHASEMGRFTVLRHGGRALGSSMIISSANGLPKSGGIVVALGDGHAEYSRLPNLWNYNWHRSWNPAAVTIGSPQ